jgi:hypothetical protein
MAEPAAAALHRVLVVDDQPDEAEALALLLREEGLAVDTAFDAEAAIERFRVETCPARAASSSPARSTRPAPPPRSSWSPATPP